jgi:hypothetical protein
MVTGGIATIVANAPISRNGSKRHSMKAESRRFPAAFDFMPHDVACVHSLRSSETSACSAVTNIEYRTMPANIVSMFEVDR